MSKQDVLVNRTGKTVSVGHVGGKSVLWAQAKPDGDTSTTTVFGVCVFCSCPAVVKLPPWLLAAQKDGATHVCHPALGGCNHGFEVVDE